MRRGRPEGLEEAAAGEVERSEGLAEGGEQGACTGRSAEVECDVNNRHDRDRSTSNGPGGGGEG